MDLKHLKTPPSAEERAAVDALLGPVPTDGQPTSYRQAQANRTRLLPVLHAVQGRAGWVSPGALGYVASRLGLPPAEVHGVASFYALYSLHPRAQTFAHVCDDVACQAAGAEHVCQKLASVDGQRWARSPCLGLCEQAPAALVTTAGPTPRDVAFGHATAEKVRAALDGHSPAQEPSPIGSLGPRKLLARVGVIDPSSLADYRAHGGYTALAKAVALGREGTTRAVTEAKLVGRGGAAFPTGRKWDAVAKAPGDVKYVVCNADESEPGTFKDRVLMEGDPFALVEAMTVAGFATGARQGFLYLRGEYPLCHQRLEAALVAARAAGLLGPNVLGAGFDFDVELRRGAGAYICGEETALFASIEGFRGEPRSKPPFPVHAGLFGKPTCINNVETLVAALDIVRDGPAAYTSVGTAGSPGTKLFCVSGQVRRPGVYEVPFGTTLGALLELAGGLERPLRAVLLGGAAGTFVGPERLSLPLSFEDTRQVGATLGSGVVLVLDDSVALLPMLQRIAAFFRDESCGQCVPCRVGTVRQEELMARLSRGVPVEQELPLFRELAQAMRDASICGLGQAAASAIESVLTSPASVGGLR